MREVGVVFSKVKIFGHPIDPMLIAYPVAFYTATLVGFMIYAATANHFWLKLTIAANVAGVAMALIAAVPGFIDWAFGIPSGSRPKIHGLRHMLLNVGALVLFAISLFYYVGYWSSAENESATLGIILSIVGVLLTVAAGFHGWMLIQDDHVGVRLTAEQERIDASVLGDRPTARRGS
jgi:uncharacterized membrane protein